ncbi:MAG: MFS transporter [Pseudomonadota bacterium]
MSIVSALRLSRVPMLGFIAIGLFWGSFAAAVPDIKANLGVGDRIFGLAMLMNAAGLVIAMYLAPTIDYLLGRRSLQVSAVLFACVMPIPVLVDDIRMFAFGMAALGFGSGLLDVLINTRVSELEARHSRPLMNANHGMFSVAYAIIAFAMGLVRDSGGAPLGVFLTASAIVLAFAILMPMIPDFGDYDDDNSSGRLSLVVYVCGIIVLIAFMSEATVETWSALHIERTLGGNPAEGALGPALLGLTMAIGRFSGQAVSERFSDISVLVVTTIMAAVGCTVAALAPTTLWAYVGFGILGLGVSVIGPIGLGLVGKFVTPAQRSNAISKASIIGFSGFFVAPALMGAVSEVFDLRIAYLCFTGLLLLMFPLIWAVARR